MLRAAGVNRTAYCKRAPALLCGWLLQHWPPRLSRKIAWAGATTITVKPSRLEPAQKYLLEVNTPLLCKATAQLWHGALAEQTPALGLNWDKP